MSVFTNTRRIIRAGFINFWRNAVVSLSAIFVTTVALFVVGSTILSSVFLQSSLEQIRDKVDVNVYFNPDVQESDIFNLLFETGRLPTDRESSEPGAACTQCPTRYGNLQFGDLTNYRINVNSFSRQLSMKELELFFVFAEEWFVVVLNLILGHPHDPKMQHRTSGATTHPVPTKSGHPSL